MHVLTPLDRILVPAPRPPETYRLDLLGRSFVFEGLAALLGAADYPKAGDRIAGLAAPDEPTREAARTILADLTLQHLHDRPFTAPDGRIDEVMRANYDIDRDGFAGIAPLTLGALKDRLLAASEAEVAEIGRALTGPMVAALAKLMDVHELILVAKKVKPSARARTLLGARGTLSSRLQPNHPTDHPDGITMLVYAGLALGAGDQLIGVNPAIDTVDNVAALLHRLDHLRRTLGVPTQICVLSHVKTQLACLARGAPVEILFQSLAGTTNVLTGEFDCTVALLDEAWATMTTRGALAGVAEQFMYFETGQGSEVSYGNHDGMDMTVCEALCYGLARRYRPFMVNNVTGFIGPETHADDMEMIVSNLQDHFMGKLMGLPMGMAPCYTLHSRIGQEGHQIATQLLTAAGANFFMDVHLTSDRMLAYFDTSGHDDQTLREVHGLRPAAEYLEWACQRGIFVMNENGSVARGPQWGDPRQFCDSEAEFQRLMEAVPAAHGFECAGPRPANAVARRMRAHQAVARSAIRAPLDIGTSVNADLRHVRTAAPSKEAHLGSPSLGAQLAPEDAEALRPEHTDVQIVISDGLSAEAVHHNVPVLLPVLLDGFGAHGLAVGRTIVAPLGRVKLAEALTGRLHCRVVVMLIGERPGGDAQAARSLSAYLALRLDGAAQAEAARFSGNADIAHEYSVVSNIHAGGLPPFEAGSVIVEKVLAILDQGAAGNRLEHCLSAG